MAGEIEVENLATAYRRLVLWFGAQLIVSFGRPILSLIPEGGTRTGLSFGLAAGALVTVGALAYYGYSTARALGSTVGWLWGLAMFVPCANVITLLALSWSATRTCRANGIPVGFFGPRMAADGSMEGISETDGELETYEPEWRKIGSDQS